MKYATIFLIIVVGCTGKQPEMCPKNDPSRAVTVHAFGDSITAGVGAKKICDGFAYIFAKKINANIDNQAVNGSILAHQLPAILALKKVGPKDIHILLPGFNDVSIYGNDPKKLSAFQGDLTRAATHLAPKGRMTLIGTTLYITKGLQGEKHTDPNVDLYNKVIKKVVRNLQKERLKVYLVDTNFKFDPTKLTENDYHPSELGHYELSKFFYESYFLNL